MLQLFLKSIPLNLNILSFFSGLSEAEKKFQQEIKILTGFKPKNIGLYKKAFTHKSAHEAEHNERLEFLGDSILNSIISEYLFEHYKQKNEGFLTQMRSRIVSRESLNRLGKKMLLKDLMEYKQNVNFKNSSVLGNTFEALISAVYLDLGYQKTYQFVTNKIINPYISLSKLESTEINFKSQLLEWCQKEKKELSYSITTISSDKPTPMYEAIVFIDGIEYQKGNGRSKKRAEQFAAEKTIKQSLNLK